MHTSFNPILPQKNILGDKDTQTHQHIMCISINLMLQQKGTLGDKHTEGGKADNQ